MTVCVAAVCGAGTDNGPFIVAAADRMITIGQLQYEPAQTKIIHFADKAIGLFAGDMQLHATVAQQTIARLKEIFAKRQMAVSELAEIYAEEFMYYRRAMAEREILAPLNMTFDSLARATSMQHYQVTELTDRLTSYSIESTAIIAGLDETGGHLFKIENPGRAVCYDTPYFVAIGAGEELARTQFIVSGFDKTWPAPNALWLTFSAKARAQAAGGVGRETDVIIISNIDPKIHTATDAEKEMLTRLFGQVVTEEEAASERAAKKIHDYIEALAQTEDADAPSKPATGLGETPPDKPD